MNRTEERLTEALRGVGDTLGPHDVPAPDFRRGRAFARRPLLAVAGAALAVAAVVGASVAVTGDDGGGERRSIALAAPPDRRVWVTTFLCAKTSANPACAKTDATPAQRRVLKKVLDDMPSVRKVAYESRSQAYERFKERFSESDIHFFRSVKNGDVPASYRAEVPDVRAARELRTRLRGLPGTDQVIIEGARIEIRLCARTSSNPACRGRDVTPAQRDALARALTRNLSLPDQSGPALRAAEGEQPPRDLSQILSRLKEQVERGGAAGIVVIGVPGADANSIMRTAREQPGVDRVTLDEGWAPAPARSPRK